MFHFFHKRVILTITLLLSISFTTLSKDTLEEKKLIAYYPMNGNLKDSSANKYDLSPLSKKEKFSLDIYLKKSKNKVLGPGEIGIALGGINKNFKPKLNNGLTICGFFKQVSGNDFGGKLFGFGSDKYGEQGLFAGVSWGIITIKASPFEIKRYKRIELRVWHHIALVLDKKESSTKLCSLYIDGKKVTSTPADYKKSLGIFAVATFGGKQIDGLMMDEVKVFNYPLNSEELTSEAKKRGVIENEITKRKALLALQSIKSKKRFQIPKAPIKLKGDLKVHFLTKNWICIIGDYTDFLRKRFKIDCGSFLTTIDKNKAGILGWVYNFHYNFAADDLLAFYRPKILRKFENKKSFKIKNNNELINITKNSYWINAIGKMRVKTILEKKEQDVPMADVAHFAFLKVEQPFKNGSKYIISTNDDEKISFTYNEKKNVSWIIKVNQVGYLPNAGRKYAYIGGWLGHGGTLDLSKWIGKVFYLLDSKSKNIVFTGRIKLRMKDTKKGLSPWTGEDVYDMNFSEFKKSGKYFIYIPGIGKSWDFKISQDALGEAFYTHARGLYHKRCGIAKKKPYTNWTMGECHKKTYRAAFPPNINHYKKQTDDKNWGIFDENGKHISDYSFSVINDTKTNELLPNVWGGWHDAGDYDRRTFHFIAVRDLLSAYLMFPENFTDNQLNIPESGNGIPDIIDEAAWGVDVWRRAQNSEGGVGCWIEATSHPKNANPHKDTQKYYLALPTRESSIDYAAHAALLAFAYKQCGAKKQSKLFLDSAVRAYNYAINPKNTIDVKWKHLKKAKKGEKTGQLVDYRYKEPDTIPGERYFKAACNLYLLTKKSIYAKAMKENEKEFKRGVADMHWRLSSFYFSEILYLENDFPEYTKIFKKRVIELANLGLDWQTKYAYRNLWWPPDHGYATFMGWGSFLPLRKARVFIVAYRISNDKKYKDAALLCNDWQNGTNPMGRSLTSGLGKVYPVRFLDLPSYADGIDEYLPGITLYFLTFGMAYQDISLVHGLFINGRADCGFKGYNISLLPKTEGGTKVSFKDLTAKLDKIYPIWKRFCNVENLAVPQNEYTIWETISPNAALTGCLMGKGWKPSEKLKNRKPAKSIKKLYGYIAQP